MGLNSTNVANIVIGTILWEKMLGYYEFFVFYWDIIRKISLELNFKLKNTKNYINDFNMIWKEVL